MTKIYIERTTTLKLTPSEIKTCKSLTLKKGGYMRSILTEMIDGYEDNVCFLARLNNRSGKIVGWALMLDEFKYNTKAQFYYYINTKYRRQGIGKKLLKRSQEFIGFLYSQRYVEVFPHDDRSTAFFNKTNMCDKYGIEYKCTNKQAKEIIQQKQAKRAVKKLPT